MEIIDNTNVNKLTFGEILVGTVFRVDNGSVYMKTNNAGDYKAVNMRNGKMVSFQDEDEILLLEATLTVKEYR